MDNYFFILEVIGIVMGLAIQTWLIIKYLVDRMDAQIESERQKRQDTHDYFQQELNHFKDNHVRRDDFHRHVDNVEKQITNLVGMISQLGQQVDARLNTMISILTNSKTKGDSNDQTKN